VPVVYYLIDAMKARFSRKVTLTSSEVAR
jgi:hypothetical protein